MEAKTIFKVGDKVFDIRWGWGEIVENLKGDFLIKFHPTNPMLYNEKSIQLVSFTEYTLEGFSQERPEVLPNEGDIVWVKEDLDQYYWQIGHFYKKVDNRYLVSSGRPDGWSISGAVMTTTNPYANKQQEDGSSKQMD